MESEFIEPRGPWTAGGDSWYVDLGGLKLTGTNVDEIKIAERGWVEIPPSTQDSAGMVSWKTHYDFDYTAQAENSVRTNCNGKPKRKFFIRVVDYNWQGGGLADRLNQDARLRDLLISNKAPAIEVVGKHIYTTATGFAGPGVFLCLDQIARHVRGEPR